MKSPAISVIMPAYNHDKYVGEAIESVLHQTFSDFELIIINDGSTDNTGNVIRSYNDKRIYYHSQENKDAFNTINRGLLLAKGKYISIINSDDVYHEERLSSLVKAIEKHDARFLITNTCLIDDKSLPINDPLHVSCVWFERLLSIYKETKSLELTYLSGNLGVTTSNYFFSSEAIKDVGIFSSYRYSHDYDYALRALAKYRDKFMFLEDKIHLNYRVHVDNTISKSSVGVTKDVLNILLNNLPNFISNSEDQSKIKFAGKSFIEMYDGLIAKSIELESIKSTFLYKIYIKLKNAFNN
jgi:glycosyltransferase involved in cell wall biosynthesis